MSPLLACCRSQSSIKQARWVRTALEKATSTWWRKVSPAFVIVTRRTDAYFFGKKIVEDLLEWHAYSGWVCVWMYAQNSVIDRSIHLQWRDWHSRLSPEQTLTPPHDTNIKLFLFLFICLIVNSISTSLNAWLHVRITVHNRCVMPDSVLLQSLWAPCGLKCTVSTRKRTRSCEWFPTARRQARGWVE